MGSPQNFGFLVFPKGETVSFIEYLYVLGPSKSDTTHIYDGPGYYYIKVLVANVEKWTLIIEAYIPE